MSRRDLLKAAAGSAVMASAVPDLGRLQTALPRGQIRTVAGVSGLSVYPLTQTPGPALSAGLGSYLAISAGTPGSFVLAESQPGARPGQETSLVVRWDEATGQLSIVGGVGTQQLDGRGRACVISVAGSATAFPLVYASGIATDSAGNVYVSTIRRPCNGMILRISQAGDIELLAGGGPIPLVDGGRALGAQLLDPSAVAVDANGNAYVAELGAGRVRKISPRGIIETIAGGGPLHAVRDGADATAGRLQGPAGLAAGQDGSVFVAESRAGKIRKITPSGVISTIAGTETEGDSGDDDRAVRAQLRGPSGICLSADGTLFVADKGNQRVRSISADGVIRTVAGTGRAGFAGDGGPAKAALLYNPASVAVGGSSLFVAEEGNRVIREIAL